MNRLRTLLRAKVFATNVGFLLLFLILSTGNGHSAPLNAAPYSNVLVLDGVNDYASVADNASLDLGIGSSEDFTIEAFFYVPNTTDTSTDTLIWKAGAYGIKIQYKTSEPDVVQFYLITGSGSSVGFGPGVNLAQGWHHIAGVFDNEFTSTQDHIAVFLDGVRSLNTAYDFTIGVANTSNPVHIGAELPVDLPFNGSVDEVRFSNVVRYSGATYTVPTAPFVSDANTRALWHFDDVVNATTFVDSSPNGNTLTGVNGAHTDIPIGSGCPAFPYTVPAGSAAALINAINCANTTAGNQVINLTNSTYTLTAVNNTTDGDNGLPVIASIESSGTLTIHGNGATIARSSAGGTPLFRILEVGGGGSLSIDHVTIQNGNAGGDNGGGGIKIQDSVLSVSDSTFTGNRAWDGGAIYHFGGTLTVTNVTFSGNSASSGAGISTAGTMNLSNSTFTANTANFGFMSGGAISNGGGTVTVSGTTFSGNSADYGGGIFNAAFGDSPGNLTVTNSTFSQNTANLRGGGIYNGTANLTLNDSTLSGNSAVDSGGGIWNHADGSLTLRNTLIANSSSGADCVNSGGTLRVNYSLVEDGSCGVVNGVNGNKTGDPLLGALQNNGGTTQTMALQAGSPAINAGSNALIPAGVTTDQRGTGFPRVVNTNVDMGAFEIQVACPSFPYTVPANNTSALIHAIYCANNNGTATNDVINLTNSTYEIAVLNNQDIHYGASGLPVISDAGIAGTLTIHGNGATIIRNSSTSFRLISVAFGAVLTIDGVKLQNGSGSGGAGILNYGTLSIYDSLFSGNKTNSNYGGGISNYGVLTVHNTTFSDNQAPWGGGISNRCIDNMECGIATISGSTFVNNIVNWAGGGIYN